MYSHFRRLIEDLIQNLQAAGQQALKSVGNFVNGLGEQLQSFREDLQERVAQLGNRVRQAIQDITGRLQNIPSAVGQCVEVTYFFYMLYRQACAFDLK